MATKDWGTFYTKKEITLSRVLDNLASHKELFERIIISNPSKILEVGSGSGSMPTFLSWLGYDVTSIDNDRQVLTNADIFTKKWNGRCSYKYADAFTLTKSFKPNTFDVAFSQGTLEHFSDEQIKLLIDQQLSIARRVIFSVPSYYYRRLDYGNERLMTERQWRAILNKYQIVFLVLYAPKQRGIKSLLQDFFTQPWRLLPWRQPVQLLVEVTL